jgi:hypothetical protein
MCTSGGLCVFVLIFMLIRGKSLRIVLSSWKTIGLLCVCGCCHEKSLL